jgi:predicted branched-subunit amino acid permease
MVARCPQCGLLFERGEQGYAVGAHMFNIAAAELVFIALFIGMLVATWADPPWKVIAWASGAVALLLPLRFYPFSKALLFHPADPPVSPGLE